MKNILIAATVVGSAVAGVILYLRKSGAKKLNATDSLQLGDGLAGKQMNMAHTMG